MPGVGGIELAFDLESQALGLKPAGNVSGVDLAKASQMLMGLQIHVGFCYGGAEQRPCPALKAKARGEQGGWRGSVQCRVAVGVVSTACPGTITGLGTWREMGTVRHFWNRPHPSQCLCSRREL